MTQNNNNIMLAMTHWFMFSTILSNHIVYAIYNKSYIECMLQNAFQFTDFMFKQRTTER